MMASILIWEHIQALKKTAFECNIKIDNYINNMIIYGYLKALKDELDIIVEQCDIIKLDVFWQQFCQLSPSGYSKLDYLIKTKNPPVFLIKKVVETQNLVILEWLLKINCSFYLPHYYDAYEYAISENKLAVLRFLLEYKKPKDISYLINIAIKQYNLQALKIIHDEFGIPIDINKIPSNCHKTIEKWILDFCY